MDSSSFAFSIYIQFIWFSFTFGLVSRWLSPAVQIFGRCACACKYILCSTDRLAANQSYFINACVFACIICVWLFIIILTCDSILNGCTSVATTETKFVFLCDCFVFACSSVLYANNHFPEVIYLNKLEHIVLVSAQTKWTNCVECETKEIKRMSRRRGRN